MLRKFFYTSTAIFMCAFIYANGKVNDSFFDRVDDLLKKSVKEGVIDYSFLLKNSDLEALLKEIDEADLSAEQDNIKKAFYINSYNLLVIKSVLDVFPINSVQEVNGFFDKKKHSVAGENLTLNDIEKNKLLKPYKDAKFHFVLVCGALGCPPITDFAYRPEMLASQLERQTQKAVDNPEFIVLEDDNNTVKVSEIFKWYIKDFGGTKSSVLGFINQYRSTKISSDYSVNYYTYDWSLNQTNNSKDPQSGDENDNNSSRYVVSAAIAKGSHELKLFNNLYSQTVGDANSGGNRSTFFTSTFSYLYGLNGRFNIGFEARYRMVSNSPLPSSNFDVFRNLDNSTSRSGLTYVGPRIRWAPSKKLSHFSLQSTFLIPTGKEQEGIGSKPYIDWNNPSWITQFYYDNNLGGSFSLFTEIDLFYEDIGSTSNGAFNRVSTPITTIVSFFPNPKTTLYALGSYAPFFQTEFDYFYQFGGGAKYQFTPRFELEVLYTFFTNKFLLANNGKANTVNLGLRKSF